MFMGQYPDGIRHQHPNILWIIFVLETHREDIDVDPGGDGL